MLLIQIYTALYWFLRLLSIAIFIYVLLTWVAPASALCRWLERLVSPVCAPFRRLGRYICLRWGSPLDFTCVFAMIAIELAQSLLRYVFQRLLLW